MIPCFKFHFCPHLLIFLSINFLETPLLYILTYIPKNSCRNKIVSARDINVGFLLISLLRGLLIKSLMNSTNQPIAPCEITLGEHLTHFTNCTAKQNKLYHFTRDLLHRICLLAQLVMVGSTMYRSMVVYIFYPSLMGEGKWAI